LLVEVQVIICFIEDMKSYDVSGELYYDDEFLGNEMIKMPLISNMMRAVNINLMLTQLIQIKF
jgi:hypothetical protein